MTPKPQWELILRHKIKESYAKGGFLTTDADGSWKVDEDNLYSFMFAEKEISYQQGVEDMRRKCVDVVTEFPIGPFSSYEDMEDLANLIKDVK